MVQYDRVASCMAMDIIRALNYLLAVLFVLILDVVRFLFLSLRSRAALSAENTFLSQAAGPLRSTAGEGTTCQ